MKAKTAGRDFVKASVKATQSSSRRRVGTGETDSLSRTRPFLVHTLRLRARTIAR